MLLTSRGRPPHFERGSASRIYQCTAPKRGSAFRIHQDTAPHKGVRLQNSSRYSPSKGGLHFRHHQVTAPQKEIRLQNSSTYSPPKGCPSLEFINQGIFTSRFHQLDGGPPLEFINIKLAVRMKHPIYNSMAYVFHFSACSLPLCHSTKCHLRISFNKLSIPMQFNIQQGC